LWASTSTKNPAYRDVVYVEELIAPHTVDTMPPATIDAFRDHGEVRGATAKQDVDRSRRDVTMLAELGIDLADLTRQLEEDGIKQFSDAFDTLTSETDKKAQTIRAEQKQPAAQRS